MGITSGILQAAQVATTVADTAGTYLGQRQQAGAIRDAAAFDTAQADFQANEATARGEFDASRRAVGGRQMVGAQRAAAAASGIDANAGSAADIQAQEAGLSAFDQQMIRNDANRTAWGFKAQATLNARAAENEAAALERDSYSTLLTGAGKTYNLFANRSKKRAPDPSNPSNPVDSLPAPQYQSTPNANNNNPASNNYSGITIKQPKWPGR